MGLSYLSEQRLLYSLDQRLFLHITSNAFQETQKIEIMETSKYYENERVICQSPNIWCIKNGYTEGKIYDGTFCITAHGPELWVVNDKNINLKVPMNRFEPLKMNRQRKIEKLYG